MNLHLKKTISFLTAAFLMLSLVSCSSESDTSADGAGGDNTSQSDTGGESSGDSAPESNSEDSSDAETPEPSEDESGSIESDDDSAEDIYNTDYYSAGLDENGFFEGITASDYITLPDYKGIEIPESVFTASEDDIQAQVDILLSEVSERLEVTDRAVVFGDTLNIDYVGSIDGAEFAGGNTGGAGTEVTIGVTNYIDDFLEQLVGHTPGENFDIEVTFPEDYGSDELNGKDAVFNVTINYIVEYDVPEFNDEFAQQYNFESVEAMEDDISDWLVEKQIESFIDELLSQSVCEEIPQSVIDYYSYYLEMTFLQYADSYGISIDDFLTYSGYGSMDDLIADSQEEIKNMAVFYLAIQAIAELEGLSASDEDLESFGLADYVDYYGINYMRQYALSEYIVPEFITSNAK